MPAAMSHREPPHFDRDAANAFAMAATFHGCSVREFVSRETLYSGPAFFTHRPSHWIEVMRGALGHDDVTSEYYDSNVGWAVRLVHSSQPHHD